MPIWGQKHYSSLYQGSTQLGLIRQLVWSYLRHLCPAWKFLSSPPNELRLYLDLIHSSLNSEKVFPLISVDFGTDLNIVFRKVSVSRVVLVSAVQGTSSEWCSAGSEGDENNSLGTVGMVKCRVFVSHWKNSTLVRKMLSVKWSSGTFSVWNETEVKCLVPQMSSCNSRYSCFTPLTSALLLFLLFLSGVSHLPRMPSSLPLPGSIQLGLVCSLPDLASGFLI